MIRPTGRPSEARHRGRLRQSWRVSCDRPVDYVSGTVTPTDGGLVRGKPRRTVNTWREVIDILAGGLGFEPRLAESESDLSSGFLRFSITRVASVLPSEPSSAFFLGLGPHPEEAPRSGESPGDADGQIPRTSLHNRLKILTADREAYSHARCLG